MTRGWRGPLLAAMVVLVSALPGLVRLPPLDRDEARFAQSTAQMLETGDFVNIRFQDQPRDKKPPGINWLQALSVQMFSSVERRQIWAYRLPSLAGAMLAAAACAWGATLPLGPWRGFLAGAVLGASFLLSSEAFIAKTDAALCGATTLSMAALWRLYAAARGFGPAPSRAKPLFWGGQAAAILIKGPIGPMAAGLAMIALWIAERRADWLKRLGWVWGLLAVALVVGPWAVAITVQTDGSFWTGAVGGDLAPKLAGSAETHGASPGYHLLLTPLLFFPMTFLLPPAAVYAWRRRREPFARFALAWLIPSWLVFEAVPTKLPHYPLPLYGALAWLAAGAIGEPLGRLAAWIGALLMLLAAAAFTAAPLLIASRYGAPDDLGWAAACATLALVTGCAGAAAMLWRRLDVGVLAAGGLGVLTHMAITGGLVPRLSTLFPSRSAAELLASAHLDPRNGVTPGPVSMTGYAEPSLVFALGTPTEIDTPEDAAEAVAQGQPALVEDHEERAFQAALRADKVRAQAVGSVRGFDYSDNQHVVLTLWRNLAPPSPSQ